MRPRFALRLAAISDRETFAALRRSRCRVRHGPLTLTYVPAASTPLRVGFAIGRHVGTAVVRNRIRRRLRAQLTSMVAGSGLLPDRGALLVGASAAVAEMSHDDLRTYVSEALTKMIATMERATPSPEIDT